MAVGEVWVKRNGQWASPGLLGHTSKVDRQDYGSCFDVPPHSYLTIYRSASRGTQWLARRPAEIAAAEQMQMEMEDGTGPPPMPLFQDSTVAGEEAAFRARAGRRPTAVCQALPGPQVAASVNDSKCLRGANQDVRGRLRTDVLEGEDIRIFIDDFRWNLLRGDFCRNKQSALIGFPPAGVPSSRTRLQGG